MVRSVFRASFWQRDPVYYRDVVFQSDPLPHAINDYQLTSDQRNKLVCYGSEEKPLFVGHCWM